MGDPQVRAQPAPGGRRRHVPSDGWSGLAVRLAIGPGLWILLALLLLVPTGSFLIVAVMPRLFHQGSSWFTFAAIATALQGSVLQATLNSLLVATVAAGAATVIGGTLAWLVHRTTLPGRRVWPALLWPVLLVPTFITSVGWESVLAPGGLLSTAGMHAPWLTNTFFGPVGVMVVLGARGVPFAYFAVAMAVAGLGRELEEAARVHGAGRLETARILGPLLGPALLAGFVVVFAEAIGDYGVGATLAANAHYPIATYTLYEAVYTFPSNYPVAAAIGWLLVGCVALALALQARVVRGRSYAVLGGRTRFATPHRLGRVGSALGVLFAAGFFVVALGVPVLGAISTSLLVPFAPISVRAFTLSAYTSLGNLQLGALGGSLLLSGRLALISASVTLVLAALLARILTWPRLGAVRRLLDAALLAALALPGVVFGAGYIFFYNLPALGNLGLHLYGTILLLVMAYIASALPATTRILIGPMAQLHGSLATAARVHGATQAGAWRHAVLPLLARSLLWGWLLAFAASFLELPISEMLAPPGTTPVAVAIVSVLGKAEIAQSTALSMVAIAVTLGVIGVALTVFRLLAPAGWRRLDARSGAPREGAVSAASAVKSTA